MMGYKHVNSEARLTEPNAYMYSTSRYNQEKARKFKDELLSSCHSDGTRVINRARNYASTYEGGEGASYGPESGHIRYQSDARLREPRQRETVYWASTMREEEGEAERYYLGGRNLRQPQ